LEGTLSRWYRLHLQWLADTNPHWARVVGYGPFSLCVIHKEGLCPCGDINRLMVKAGADGQSTKNHEFLDLFFAEYFLSLLCIWTTRTPVKSKSVTEILSTLRIQPTVINNNFFVLT
jgi:hypothetical protein